MSNVQYLNPKAEVLKKIQALAMNINAAMGLQDVMKSNLGPKGTLKMYLNIFKFFIGSSVVLVKSNSQKTETSSYTKCKSNTQLQAWSPDQPPLKMTSLVMAQLPMYCSSVNSWNKLKDSSNKYIYKLSI